MNGLLLHPATEQQLREFSDRPAQAIVLTGPAGSGKFAVATNLAERILEFEAGGLEKYGYFMAIKPESEKSIGIEAIRELEHFLSLKVPSDRPYNRVVIIENGHLLTLEAQNALLKTLEEPPAGTVLLLTADRQQSLLPTIQSRVQALRVQQPAKGDLEKYFAKQGNDASEISRAHAASGGNIGLMTALLNQEDHPLNTAILEARALLSQPPVERLVTIDRLSKDRDLAIDTVNVLGRMATVSLQTATGKAAEQWKRILAASYHTVEALKRNAQPKLALTELVLQF